MEAALLTPAAIDRQALMVTGKGTVVQVSCRAGALSGVDRSIIKYLFEQGTSKENFHFADAE